ncbi:uncharacterized protein VNE69_07241 [Vairimorpha necatrix]|uniref:Uncharacterized protein n=1 Tax=Vairimorpha necatrix TaxID=6039 RepID=A0AAX4JDT4_9MICR
MISEQIKKYKKTSHTNLRYSESEDLDTESLLDLIPEIIPRTKYLSTTSLHFDRLRLTSIEEFKFNKKFKLWLMSLVIYGEEEGYEYLLDFLIRKYKIHEFNERELLFITLPFPKYYTNQIRIFDFLKSQKTFSTEFIAECCAKYVDFFFFFIDYFDYYEEFKFFLNEVIDIFIVKNISKMNKHIDALNEIKNKLNNEDNLIVKKINDSLEGKIFKNNLKINSPRIVKNTSEYLIFYENNSSRNLLNNFDKLKEYIICLKENELKDKNFTEEELKILNFIIFKENRNLNDFCIEDNFNCYLKLVEEIEPKEELFKILYKKFKKELLAASNRIFDFYTKEDILKIIDKDNYKDSPIKDKEVLVKAMEFITFDPSVFNGTMISQEDVLSLFEIHQNDKVFLSNLKFFCEVNKLNTDLFNNEKYKTFSELNIENCRDIEIIIDHYKEDREIIKRVNHIPIIIELCSNLGYEEVLNNYDLNFIIKISNEMQKNNNESFNSDDDEDLEFLKYLIDRFNIEDILFILKDQSRKLINFVDHDKFYKLKCIIQEFATESEDCKFIYKIFYKNFKKYRNHLDLLYLYKKEFGFINDFKDQILENFSDLVEVIDFYICNTDYSDIRIINKVSSELIKRQKKSILLLFDQFANVMIPYIGEFIKNFNFIDSYKNDTSLLKLSPNVLLRNIVKYKKTNDYEYQIIRILKQKDDIDLNIFNSVITENTNKECVLSADILYAIVKHKYKKDVEFDVSRFLDILYIENINLFMKLTKYFPMDIKDLYYNKIVKNKSYNLINKSFASFNLDNEDIVFDYIKDYYDGQNIETEISILSNNIKNIKKFNKTILKNLDNEIYRTLILISKCVDNNKEYEVCHKDIHQSIILLVDSKDENIKKLSREIYDKIIKNI